MGRVRTPAASASLPGPTPWKPQRVPNGHLLFGPHHLKACVGLSQWTG